MVSHSGAVKQHLCEIGHWTGLNLSPLSDRACHCAENFWPLSLCGGRSLAPGDGPGDQHHSFLQLHIQGPTHVTKKPQPECYFSRAPIHLVGP